MSDCSQLSNILMMNNETSALKEGVNTLKSRVDELREDSEKRRSIQEDLNTNVRLMMQRMDEANKQYENHADMMEQLHTDVTTLNAGVMGLKVQVDSMKNDIKDIKESRFNWPKFMSGLVTVKGMFIIACITIIVLALTGLGEHIPAIFKIFKV